MFEVPVLPGRGVVEFDAVCDTVEDGGKAHVGLLGGAVPIEETRE